MNLDKITVTVEFSEELKVYLGALEEKWLSSLPGLMPEKSKDIPILEFNRYPPLEVPKINESLPYAQVALTQAIEQWEPSHLAAPEFAPRSGKWPRLRAIHMQQFPYCALCSNKLLCVPHHIKPFHLHPEYELDPDNLITLCPPHHLLFGHLMNWRAFNPRVVEDCKSWKMFIEHRPVAAEAATGPYSKNALYLQSDNKCDDLFAKFPEIV